MYLKRIQLENVGPITALDLELPFDEGNGHPKPVILVGPNGSGKSIFLSHVVNSLLDAKQKCFEDSEMEKGRVYKYRSPAYIHTGASYYYAKLEFESSIESVEWQLHVPRKTYEQDFSDIPHPKDWRRLREEQASVFWSNSRHQREAVTKLLNHNCALYFPPNRFEEPAWLNYENLVARANFPDVKRVRGRSNRTIPQYAPLAEIRNWFLDIVLDRSGISAPADQLSRIVEALRSQLPPPVISAVLLQDAIERIQRLIIAAQEPLTLMAGSRHDRKVLFVCDGQLKLPNIFQLSTGETSLLGLFLSILRDYDLTEEEFTNLKTVRGIVLVDEIDSHLHCDHQIEVLPSLIKLFPQVQFIVTSHSPLFLLGMKKHFGEDDFHVLSLPEGKRIGAEQFAEFQTAYEAYKDTSRYEEEIAKIVRGSAKDVVFVGGRTDVVYIRRAAEVLGKQSILDKVQLRDGDGDGSLTKCWRIRETPVSQALQHRVILLFDCDVDRSDDQKGKIAQRVIPRQEDNPIEKGIENLFPRATIAKARAARLEFIDVTPEHTKTIRGKGDHVPEKLEVNSDEKRNLCNWLCEHGTAEDFAGFIVVFDLIEDAIAKT